MFNLLQYLEDGIDSRLTMDFGQVFVLEISSTIFFYFDVCEIPNNLIRLNVFLLNT